MNSVPIVGWSETRRLIRADLETYEVWLPGARPDRASWRRLVHALIGTEMFTANLFYRLQIYVHGAGWSMLAHSLKSLSRILCAVTIGNDVRIGGGLYIAHGHVVVDGACRIGRRCSMGPFVTLGLANTAGSAFEPSGPRLGDDVLIGTGAKILGAVDIGDRAFIGANAVVVSDVPAEHTAAGVPARTWPTGAKRSGASSDRVVSISR